MQRTKYQLPYPAPFPNWSRYYQPAVTSRPFLTVDDKYAHLSPRLFPVQLAANLISPPLPPGNPALTVPLPPSASSSSRPINNINNLCVVPDSSSNASLIAATPDSTLANVAVYQLDGDEFVNNTVAHSSRISPTKKQLARIRNNINHADYVQPPIDKVNSNINIINNKKVMSDTTKSSAVYGLQAVECDDDGGLLLANLSDNLCIGRYNSGGKELIWVEDIPVPNLRASTVNRIALTEFAALDNFSLSVYDIATATCTLTGDIQPISPSHSYRWIRYGSHPRAILVASKRNICRYDLRSNTDMFIVNPVDAWNLCPKVDNGISYFECHPNNPFISVLTTGSILAVIDHRMVRNPLLEWNITYGNDISNAALMSINEDTNDIAIALSANITSDLQLFHITSDFKISAEEILLDSNDPANLRRFHSYDSNYNYGNIYGNSDTESDDEDAPVVNHPHMLWSDMPLCHLEQFPPGNELRGIALLPENGNIVGDRFSNRRTWNKKFSLVQASRRYGIMAQRIGCEKFKDGTYAFEAPQELKDDDDVDIDENEERSYLLYGVDSAVDILNTRDAMLVEAEGPEAAREIIEQAIEPGMRMVKRLKCLDTRDVLAVRKVLEDDGEFVKDEDDGDGIGNKKKRKLE